MRAVSLLCLPALVVLLMMMMMMTATAARGEVTLAVIPLDGLGVDPAVLDELDAGVRKEVAKLGIASLPNDSVAAAARAQPCAGDVACLADLGAQLGASKVVAGSVGLAADEVHITLKSIEVATGKVINTVDEAAPAGQAEVRVRATTMKLLAPDRYNTSGSLAVNISLSDAEIVIDGQVKGTTPLFGPIDGITPGRRDVEVRYPGRRSWRGFVDVSFDEAYKLDLVEKGDAIVLRVGSDPTAASATEGAPVLLMAGIGVAVVGVAAGIGAAIEFASAASAFDQVVQDGPTDELIAQNRNASLAYGVLLPLSLGCVIIGGGLIAWSTVE